MRLQKQDYLTVAPFALIMQRAIVRHALGSVGCVLARSSFWFVWRFWQAVSHPRHRAPPKPWWCRIRGPSTKSYRMKQVRLRTDHVRLSCEIKAAASTDILARGLEKCKELEEAALEGCCRRLFAILRMMKPWAPRRSYRLLANLGIPAASDYDKRMVARTHFEGKLEATSASFKSLIDDDRECVHARQRCSPCCCREDY